MGVRKTNEGNTVAKTAAPSAPSADWITVTPEQAAEWLDRNHANRNLRAGHVNTLAQDMKDGNWANNGEAIKLDVAGNLLDGQHRLAALVKVSEENPDFTLELFVIQGLDKVTQATMDTGTRRKFADVLTMNGYGNSAIVTATLRRIMMWDEGLYTQRRNFAYTNNQMLQALSKYPNLDETVRMAANLGQRCHIPASVLGLAIHLFYDIDQADAEKFFDLLGTGEDLKTDHPIYRLRYQAMNGTSKRYGPQTQLVALVIKAWNLFRDGETVQQLMFRAGGAKPENFPMPH